MAEAASDGHTAPLGVRIDRGGLDLVDWATLKKRSRDLLRGSKDQVSCLARMREKTLVFFGLDSVLKKGNRVQNSEKIETEKGKKEYASEKGDWDHVGMNSEKKTDISSRLGGEVGSLISSVPVFLPPLGCWRYMHRVQQDVLHQLGWKKGIAVERSLESTVVIFELQGEEAMIQYDKISCFCSFWGYLCHSEKSCESKFKRGVPSGNSSGSSTGRMKNNDSLMVSYGPLDVQMSEADSGLGKRAAEQTTAAMQANVHNNHVVAKKDLGQGRKTKKGRVKKGHDDDQTQGGMDLDGEVDSRATSHGAAGVLSQVEMEDGGDVKKQKKEMEGMEVTEDPTIVDAELQEQLREQK